MKLIIFILIVLIIAALLIRIILRSVNQHSPLLMQLHAAGIRTGDAERILSGGEYDASHLRPERRRRDILLEEVLRQAGIPLLRSHDARKLLQMTGEWLNTTGAAQQSPEHRSLRVAQLSNPGNGKKQVFPAPGVSITENHTISQFKSH
ncbi:hypothetical protein D5F68_004906 [Escherichia coli]|nr:hypothetical protein [Escherichia coli]HAX5496754.1 hypothetical protein [Escherichia coli O157]EER7334070.1 hypothetical protein [Escherichia coli]EEW4602087.1 hypothetical protein [Escherichia coli]EEW8576189.1 hypothetical protein [Escherichia coli]